MNTHSKLQKYEQSILLKKQIESLDYIVNGWKNLSDLFTEINLDDDISSRAVLELQTTLKPYLSINKLHRIECYDISQFGTKYFVGSMTVAIDGKLDHSQYRQFKINTKYTADDQFMIREIVYRRLQHPEWGTPNLIVVDGGKPQVSSVSLLKSEKMISDISFIGLAKKHETIVIKHDNKFIEINLPENSSALNLLKNLRNEAHRFANRYRKKLIQTDLSLF
jgi:excinuclease ABC subunit C